MKNISDILNESKDTNSKLKELMTGLRFMDSTSSNTVTMGIRILAEASSDLLKLGKDLDTEAVRKWVKDNIK